MSSRNYSKTRKRSSQSNNLGRMLPIMFILCILPLICSMKVYDTKLQAFDWFPSAFQHEDYFLFYKQWLFVAAAAAMIGIIIYKAIKDKKSIRFPMLFIPLALYALLALLSSVFSDYASFSFSGIFEQFENIFALLGYSLVVYYAFLMIETEQHVRYLIYALCIGAGILSLIGVLQAFGFDIFTTDFVQSLIGSKLEINLEIRRVYATLYNPNYVGVYVSLVAPIFMYLLFFSTKVKTAVLYFIILTALLICTFGSQSKASIFAIGTGLIFSLLFLRKHLFRRWYIFIPLFGCLIGSFFIINHINDNAYLIALKNSMKIQKSEPPALTSIDTNDNNVTYVYNGNTLSISNVYENGTLSKFKFADQSGTELQAEYTDVEGNLSIKILDERYSNFTFFPASIDQFTGFGVTLDGITWIYLQSGIDGPYYYFNEANVKLTKIKTPETAIFTNYPTFATGRGFIWARTIPLLKDNIILGSGADTFLLVYPQHDYVGKLQSGFGSTYISKPHCLYLQVAVQSGVVSLIAMLLFYAIYFVWSIGLYMKGNFQTFVSQVGFAIFIGTLNYMIMGFTNDSSINTAPVFWTLLGIGIAINFMVKKERAAAKLLNEKEQH